MERGRQAGAGRGRKRERGQKRREIGREGDMETESEEREG